MNDGATLFLALTPGINSGGIFSGQGILIAVQVPVFFDDVVNLRQSMPKRSK
jgi:hypothetical protein